MMVSRGDCSPVPRGSQIPVPTFRNRQSSSESLAAAMTPPGSDIPWRQRFDQAEYKRKEIISQYLKAIRDKEELEKTLNQQKQKTNSLQKDMDVMKKEESKLRSLSEEMVKEYDLLKNKYLLETGALQEAMTRATQWYTQNRQLKRKSAVLMEKMLKVSPSEGSLFDSSADEHDSLSEIVDEIESLRKSEQVLRNQVAVLQSEVNCLRLQEFEAQEQVVDLTTLLDNEKQLNERFTAQIKELQVENENLNKVTRLAAQEMSALREQCEREKSSSAKFKSDANQAKKERNVLAHQSQILMCDAASDEKLMKALLEIENLKRALEEESQKHIDHVQALQEQLDMQQSDTKIEILEEKLKLVESELQVAVERAKRAEQESTELKSKVHKFEEKQKNSSIVPPPPPPPPPPPVPINIATPTKPKTKTNSVLEMANLLGVPRAAKPTLQPGAIDDIINELKGGRFLLKTPDKPEKKKVTEEQPPVVQEMMNVLGTLRKRPGNRTPSFRRTKNELSATQNTADILI